MVFLHNICWEKNDLPPEYWVFMFNKNWSAYKAMSFSLPKLSFLGHWFYEQNTLKNPVSWVTFPSIPATSMGTRTLLSLVLLYALTNPPFMNEWTIWFTARHCLKRICLHWFPQECKLTVLAADWLILASMAISETKKYWISFNLERTVCRKKISQGRLSIFF